MAPEILTRRTPARSRLAATALGDHERSPPRNGALTIVAQHSGSRRPERRQSDRMRRGAAWRGVRLSRNEAERATWRRRRPAWRKRRRRDGRNARRRLTKDGRRRRQLHSANDAQRRHGGEEITDNMEERRLIVVVVNCSSSSRTERRNDDENDERLELGGATLMTRRPAINQLDDPAGDRSQLLILAV